MRKTEYDKIKKLLGVSELVHPERIFEVLDRSCIRKPSPMKTFLFLESQANAPVQSENTEEKNSQMLADYQNFIKCIPRLHRLHIANQASVVIHQKKIATVCLRELRRGLSKTSKTNPSLKNKRINKELQRLNSKLSREEKDKIKKEDAETEIRKKNAEAAKEELRQKRKFNYLMSQTEAFASFFLNRQSCENSNSLGEASSAVNAQLAHLKEFDNKEKEDQIIHSNNSTSIDSNNNSKSIDSNNHSTHTAETTYVYTEIPQPAMLNATLKPYQLKGLNWLVNLYNQGINGILADDMGLGKTVQAISLLGYLAETESIWGPFLVVTPASTLHNWENEIKKFLPNFRAVVYYGNINERTELRKQFKTAHVIITSYQVAVSDDAMLKKIKWQYMILDEAQAIKSISSQRWKILLGFKARNRCLLTGTPIQNNMQELWSLLHFIMPTLFDSLSEFSEWFLTENGLDMSQVDKLHTILKPFMLRRHKDDIKDEIGTKEIHHIYCRLSTRQQALYNEILNPESNPDNGEPNVSAGNEYENVIMHLKKVCNHPDLFEKLEAHSALSFAVVGNAPLVEHRSVFKKYISEQVLLAADRENEEFRKRIILAQVAGRKQSSVAPSVRKRLLSGVNNNSYILEEIFEDIQCKRRKVEKTLNRFVFINEKINVEPITTNILPKVPCASFLQIPQRDPAYVDRLTYFPPINTFISDSGKLSQLDALLKKLKSENHRVLIYFQMTKMMDLFEEYLVKKEYSYLRLDGSCKVSARKELVNEWQNKNIFIFILSTRAGGVGINLTAADTVIFYDSDWNPTVDQQAMDRAHRIGQTKKVTVYRLITLHTVEERIMEKANQKDEMQKIVIKGKVFEG